MQLRKRIIVVAGALIMALATLAPPAHAASGDTLTQHPIGQPITPSTTDVVDTTMSGVRVQCFYPGIIYKVVANGIHIRTQPDGSSIEGIGNGQWFDSVWYHNNTGPYHCMTAAQWYGQNWVFGYKNADGTIGFVGLNYLGIHSYVN